jgi:ParB family chromosome partitioning protein
VDALASPVVSIPLKDLRVSIHNVRRRDAAAVDDLAASIRAEGLLQNLTVVAVGDGYEIVAGKRRYGALRRLKDQGQLPPELESVPCRIVANDRAQSASLAENVVRQAMHAADEFAAFKALADAGKSAEDIAQQFGVTPLVVQRRLKLANVSPKLFEKFGKGEIALDQMMALAITDDHKQQEAAWNVKDSWLRSPERIRERLTKSELDLDRDAIAKFVGARAIAAAGIAIRRDLFNEGDAGYATDPERVRALAQEKLEAKALQLRDEGWSWVETRIEFPWEARNTFKTIRAETDRSLLSKADKQRLEKLEAEAGELREQADREEADDDGRDDSALWNKIDALEDQIADIEQSAIAFTAEQLAAAGAIVTISHEGRPEIHRGMVRPGDRAPRGDKAGAKKTKDAGALSEALVRRLSAHRTAVLQGAVLRSPHLAIRVLAHTLLLGMFDEHWDEESPSQIKFSGPTVPLTNFATELTSAPHYIETLKHLAAVQKQLPGSQSPLFGWLLRATDAQVIELLTLAASQSIETTQAYRSFSAT